MRHPGDELAAGSEQSDHTVPFGLQPGGHAVERLLELGYLVTPADGDSRSQIARPQRFRGTSELFQTGHETS